MRIINSYITRGFLMTFGITLLVFLFVMAIGNIFKVIDLFSRGVSGLLILKVFSYGIPFSLIFAIPISVLASVFLLFSRLSSDSEIIAMRSCGISLWQIIFPPFIIALLLCLACVYINCNVAPDSHYARRKVLSKLGIETPLSLLDEGRFIRDFPGLTVYIGEKNNNMLKDIVIHQIEKAGVKTTIRAASGSAFISTNDPGKIHVTLRRVRIEQPDEDHPEDLTLTKYLNADEYPLVIDVRELVNREIVWKKRADLTIGEIVNTLRHSKRFVPKDLVDPDRLVARLNNPRDIFGRYIFAMLSDEAEEALEAYDESPGQRKKIARLLAEELSSIVAGPCIYAPQPFSQIRLSAATAKYLDNRDMTPEMIPLLNRMLLEEGFQDLIVKNASLDFYRNDFAISRTSLLVEANTRIALSCSCFAFVLLGAALGIKIHRKESSIGIGVSLLLVFAFYFFIIIADALVNRPEYYPYLIVWIPVFLSQGLGAILIHRAN